jgi:predicted ATPase
MPLIEGFRIQNYRALKDITFGKIGTDPDSKKMKSLTPLTAVIGKNGVGKSTLFDALGFLADCMENDIENACNIRNRGGFDKLRTNGIEEPIKITIYYRETLNERPITYEFHIGQDKKKGLPVVVFERLRQRKKNQKQGRPLSFLYLNKGIGNAWIGDESVEGDEGSKTEVTLDTKKLAIVTLAEHIKEHPRITRFKNFIQSWYLSYFTPDAARTISTAGTHKHLNLHGDNVGNVVQYLERNHPKVFEKILNEISHKIPGIGNIKTYRDKITNNLYLLFADKGFTTPFTQQQMSDGTLKMFCYLLLLRDPDPAPFICIEEPENGLYHRLLETLASEFREHATGKSGGSQVFITTHQPYFVDALKPDEVWILEKDQNGFSNIKRASDNPLIKNLYDEGLPLGGLWYSEYFDKNI